MDPAVAEKVRAVRARVAELIGVTKFDTWFGEDAEFHLASGNLDIKVANAFVGDWISANFMPQLVEATRTVLGGEPRVQVLVSGRNGRAAGSPSRSEPPAKPRSATVVAPPTDPHVRPARPALRGELDTFVVGPPNELAFSVAQALVHSPGRSFKHLVLHGGCGLGKTHLLQGICNGLSRTHPELEWSYLSGEEFTNEFIYALKAGRIDQFRARFRRVDFLVIDDIHFLANKKSTQEEFLHTFDAIDASGKTVVLSSDTHPRGLTELSEPLVNRLLAAMVVRIDPPDFATRREILRRRAAVLHCPLDDAALDALAHRVTRNVRELEGALYKLSAYVALTRQPVSLDLVQRVIEDTAGPPTPPDPDAIERTVAAYFGVTREAIRSDLREKTITLARSLTMFLIRRHTRLSFPEIGRRLGHKRHSTVLMAVRRVQAVLDRDGQAVWTAPQGARTRPLREVLDDLEAQILHPSDRA